MPVTQQRINQPPAYDVSLKPTKPQRPFVKLHAPGFNTLLPNQNEEEENQGQDRRLPRSEPRKYTHLDRYSAFFAGSNACHGTEHIPTLTNTYLRPNAKFVGTQQSGVLRYDIKVELKTVDLVSSVVTGFFQISGLTDEHPIITTCFKGEIINNPLHRTQWGDAPVAQTRYSFVTEEKNLTSIPKNDLEHWKLLTGCPGYYSEEHFRKKLQLIQTGQHDLQYIYMRWKEEFLLPDSRVKQLTGALFEGFYYIVLNIGNTLEEPNQERASSKVAPGTMSGLYFYTQSEKFQSLSLEYVDDRAQTGTFDFA